MTKAKLLGLLAAVPVLWVLGSGPSRLWAQQYFSSIVGTVTDPSGAAVPEAAVTVTNTQTGISRQVKTDQYGNYAVGSLVPGTYSINVEHSGFQTVAVPTADLPVSRTVTVNLAMQLGVVTQKVEVQATAPLLDTTNSTVGTVINNQFVVAIPLNGRNFTDLIQLIPGTVAGVTRSMVAGGTNYSLSGNRYEQVNYTLDGVINNESFFLQFAIQPSIDAIQEFKAQTNVTTAEFGQAAGANIAIATKSGTNQLHGSVYEFLRNDKLDAASFFGNYKGLPKSAFKRNQFGVAAGGPIYIPHLYNGRDKAFWFFNYEDLKVRQASTVIGTVPTTAQLGGDMRDLPPVYDPASTAQV